MECSRGAWGDEEYGITYRADPFAVAAEDRVDERGEPLNEVSGCVVTVSLRQRGEPGEIHEDERALHGAIMYVTSSQARPLLLAP